MRLADLRTPCAVVDLDVVERNTARMSARIRALGADLRAHVKTHKTVEAARLQVRGHSGAITVSTLAEARFFAAAGFRDITWAFPLPIDRIPEVAELSREVDRLNVLVDHAATVDALEAHGGRFHALLEFDCGDGRSGVDPAGDEALRLATRLAGSRSIAFEGILTHAGQSYACRSAEEIRRIARAEVASARGFAARLRETGLEVRTVSIGSTPTMNHVDDLAGITEVRPGNYVFHDAFQAAIGSCRREDCAFSVLATVAGAYPSRGELIVNAGALALSKDGGPVHVDPACGYGFVAGRPGLRMFTLSQEHGQIRASRPSEVEGLGPGSRLRIVPNHSCLSAACFDRYAVVRGDEVVGEWIPTKGW